MPLRLPQAEARPELSDEAPRSKRRRFEVPVPRDERPVRPPAHHLPAVVLPPEASVRSVSGACLSALVDVLAGALLVATALNGIVPA